MLNRRESTKKDQFMCVFVCVRKHVSAFVSNGSELLNDASRETSDNPLHLRDTHKLCFPTSSQLHLVLAWCGLDGRVYEGVLLQVKGGFSGGDCVEVHTHLCGCIHTQSYFEFMFLN